MQFFSLESLFCGPGYAKLFEPLDVVLNKSFQYKHLGSLSIQRIKNSVM